MYSLLSEDNRAQHRQSAGPRPDTVWEVPGGNPRTPDSKPSALRKVTRGANTCFWQRRMQVLREPG